MGSLQEVLKYVEANTPKTMKKGGCVKKLEGGGDPTMMAAKAIKEKYDKLMGNIGLAAGTVGGLLTASELSPDSSPNKATSIAADALKGVQAGSAYGPLGMLGGALIGGVIGKGSYMQRKELQDAQDYRLHQNYIDTRTVDQNTGYYQEGGQVESQEAPPLMKHEKSYFVPPMPMAINDVDPQSPYQHVQTEKGEMVLMPDGGLVPVKATKLHKNMKKDEVTDILPAGAYVMSDFNNKKLKKDKMDKVVLGHGVVEYEEEENDDPIKEVKMSDFMNKKEMTPAEISEQIVKKYAISSRKKDIFADATNERNKINRMPFLAKLVELNEEKRSKTEPIDTEMFKMGGKVKKYQTEGFINPEDNPDLANQILNSDPVSPLPVKLGPISTDKFKPKFTINDLPKPAVQTPVAEDPYNVFLNEAKGKFDANSKYGRLASGAGHALGAIGSALQDATVDPVLKSTKYLRRAFQGVPQYLKDYQIQQTQKPLDTLARNLGRAGYTGNQLQAILSGAAARSQDATNKQMFNYNMNDLNQEMAYNKAMQGVEDFNSGSITQAANEQRGLQNAKLARTLGYISQGLTRDASLRSKGLETQFGLDKEGFAYKQRQMDSANQAAQMRELLNRLYGKQ